MNVLPLISVIIPVYDVEKYLSRCIDSVINQTYRNLEIILVDDGSPDNSPAICDKYAVKDCRIRVIHQKNGGLSAARNAGIARSTGEYVGFIDSDDWIALDTYEYCMNLMNRCEADVVQFNLTKTSREKKLIQKQKEKIEILEGGKILEYYMLTTTNANGSYSVCRCLFKRNLLQDIQFRIGKINEDIDYKYKVLAKSSTMVVSNQVKYFYFQAENSTTNGGLKRRDFELYEAANELYKLTSLHGSASVRRLGEVKRARTAFSLLCKITFFGISDLSINKQQTVRQLTHEHRKNFWTLIKSPIPLSRKVLTLLFAMSFRMTEVLIHIVKKIHLLFR
jgi:glycosyltransferase involved in cell wall biosynthesis